MGSSSLQYANCSDYGCKVMLEVSDPVGIVLVVFLRFFQFSINIDP
jgi:hypothetical protein